MFKRSAPSTLIVKKWQKSLKMSQNGTFLFLELSHWALDMSLYSLKNQLLQVVVSTQPAKVGFSGCIRPIYNRIIFLSLSNVSVESFLDKIRTFLLRVANIWKLACTLFVCPSTFKTKIVISFDDDWWMMSVGRHI